MDSHLQVNHAPRAGVPAGLAEMPMVTIAWRALRAEHLRRADEHRRVEDETRQALDALANVAEEAYRLRRLAGIGANAPEGADCSQQLLAVAGRLEQMLAQAQVIVVAPEGEPYTTDMMELLDNIAQRLDPGLQEPLVAEVIAPAILCRGALLRRGKAVIAVPAGSDPMMNVKE